MKDAFIKIKGARQHNLKNVDLEIPKNKLIIFTGVSGSGKSSMAFDTIYAEGQRRYVESLSSYARQFLGVMDKPDVDFIEGLSPSISIDQKTTSHNPRSTVGTITEIYDYLRLLFARVGHPHCPVCGREVKNMTLDQITVEIIEFIKKLLIQNRNVRFLVSAPVIKGRKGEFTELFNNLKGKGIRYVKIDNSVKSIDEDYVLIKTNKHDIDAIVDRIAISHSDVKDDIKLSNLKSRIAESVELASVLSDGLIKISIINDKVFGIPESPKQLDEHLYSEKFMCPDDNTSIEEIQPRTLSFNSPHGACPKCFGLGTILKIDEKLLIAPKLSVLEGAIIPMSSMFERDTWYSRILKQMALENSINLRIPYEELENNQKNTLLWGSGERIYIVGGSNKEGRFVSIKDKYNGIIPELERRYKESTSDYVQYEIAKYMNEIVCKECNGTRLSKAALGITIDNRSIADVTGYSIENTKKWLDSLAASGIFSERESTIASPIILEIQQRLLFLISVGLDYLTLSRKADTLAGGEAQRIRLASQIGSGLTGVLYVLDEPTIGLHPKDNSRLINTLKKLRDLGNTVLVVEHDSEMMENSDYIVDFGPGAGKHGGKVIAAGTLSDIKNNNNSITGKYLSGTYKVEDYVNIRKSEVNSRTEKLILSGASSNNLKNINIEIPIGKLVCVSGVSGSGKSTLVVDTLYHAVAQRIVRNHKTTPGEFKNIEGIEFVNRVILVDQSPIGRTPRSNPATYTKLFDSVRDIFASTKEARELGFKKGRFSFNVKGGRCENCEGQGQTKISMQFMSDIWIKCEFCQGKRYNKSTLEVTFKGKNISEILNMTVSEAKEFFHNFKKIYEKLETLEDVGLDYVELGQSATTLSGGEAQRIKLSSELSKKGSGKTLYILDEPTTGLHFADLQKLLTVLKILVSRGNTVVVIEHNMDIIRNSDYIIDLGPEGGDKGGYIVASGLPSEISKNDNSYTGLYLKKYNI